VKSWEFPRWFEIARLVGNGEEEHRPSRGAVEVTVSERIVPHAQSLLFEMGKANGSSSPLLKMGGC
jgi:hypothetical protein